MRFLDVGLQNVWFRLLDVAKITFSLKWNVVNFGVYFGSHLGFENDPTWPMRLTFEVQGRQTKVK